MTVELSKYSDFVDGCTSEASKNTELLIQRLRELESAGVNATQLLTAGTGMAGEAGEFAEIVKKLNWHGKPFSQELRDHMEKELGDVIFYWMMACQALKLDPEEVVTKNVDKLVARYPGGVFSIERSENRADGDV